MAAQKKTQQRKRGPGRPAFKPTREQQQQVKTMAACGIHQSQIAMCLDIGERTLRKYFRKELDTAATMANAKVAQSLFHNATEKKNVTAQIFWLKIQAGWVEGKGSADLAPEEQAKQAVDYIRAADLATAP